LSAIFSEGLESSPFRAVFAGAAVGDAAAVARDLAVERVCKRFDGVPVLRDVSFTVNQGEFVTLLGPSGCGKTTLLRIVAGLELADSGRVLLGDRAIDGLPANKRPVNTVFQSYALFPHLTVFENIAFGLRARKVEASSITAKVNRALEMLQITAFAKRMPHQLSGGQRQRVALARALVNEPELLLLDEPMSALDAKLRADVQVELRRLQRQLGKTFILVTHDQDEAMTVSDRILVMRNGVIEQAGRPHQVYEEPVNRFVAEFLGSANLIAAKRNCTGVETELGHIVTREKPTWESGTIAIRPERIKVCTEQPPVNGLRVLVRDLIYRGDHLDVWVEPGPLRVRAHPSSDLRGGESVWLQLPPEHVEVLAD
jgi:spermidine/putrescine transport system ATP-binding protein